MQKKLILLSVVILVVSVFILGCSNEAALRRVKIIP